MAAGQAKPMWPLPAVDLTSSQAPSANVNVLKQAPREIMLKQPETYLTFSNIYWTFSNLDLSHYYLFKLKITKSGLSVLHVPN